MYSVVTQRVTLFVLVTLELLMGNAFRVTQRVILVVLVTHELLGGVRLAVLHSE